MSKIIISNSKKLVTLNGKPVKLADKEFGLLLYLAEHKDKVCTRTQIVHDVWDTHVIERTVDVHIRKLRQKFGQDIIEGVLKHGYKLVGDVKAESEPEALNTPTGMIDGVKTPWIYETNGTGNKVVTEGVVNCEFGRVVVFRNSADSTLGIMSAKTFKSKYKAING